MIVAILLNSMLSGIRFLSEVWQWQPLCVLHPWKHINRSSNIPLNTSPQSSESWTGCSCAMYFHLLTLCSFEGQLSRRTNIYIGTFSDSCKARFIVQPHRIVARSFIIHDSAPAPSRLSPSPPVHGRGRQPARVQPGNKRGIQVHQSDYFVDLYENRSAYDIDLKIFFQIERPFFGLGAASNAE